MVSSVAKVTTVKDAGGEMMFGVLEGIPNMEDVLFMDSDIENVEDNVNVVENDTVGDGLTVPEVGMQFNDEKEVYDFYARNVYAVGFPVRKWSSTRDDDSVLRYIMLTYSREGRRTGNTSTSLKPQPTIQTGCKARISASLDIHGYWKINAVHLDHNHKTSPTKSRLYRCNRKMTAHVKRKLEVNDIAGIPLHKSFNSAVVEAGGYENMTCIEKDCRNYIEKVRRLRLGEGDAAAIQTYFSEMQAYKEFGDVVTFDTTYLTNKYDMPFTPFVGVNHHGQSTLLGCGLVSNEDTDTFV
ncbi:protein FAR1-RELATED SEQUENCE 5-like [Olea europaea var. sylvestris]|uniref:protein FAR1-RELATED SEQUENCE 5-like n=1 Tax=Olea europaea var. sylvestris TaxID=158386 RepID=UPI000C1D0722|nr:protein FAR1-RELATED SEQUENCE 5-like [Olea europaea var. sylvestris]